MTHHTPAWLRSAVDLRLVTPPTYWRCEPSWSWRARPLPDYLLWCVLGGVGELSLAGRSTSLEPGTCVVFAPGDAPVASHDPRQRLLVFGMHFTVDAVDPPRPEQVVPPGRWCRVRDQALLNGLARRSDRCHRRDDVLGHRHARLCLEQILALLWDDALYPAPGSVDAVLDELAHALRQDPGRRWTVAELAAQAGLSRAQFTRRFTARVGLTPAKYLIQARVDRARQLLAETDMTVTMVAATLGYTEISHFSRQFKQYTSQSPRAVGCGGASV